MSRTVSGSIWRALPTGLRRASPPRCATSLPPGCWPRSDLMRFASAQLIAYVENGLWLDMARASNGIAARIAAALRDIPAARLLAPIEANEIFLELPDGMMDALERDGFLFYRRSRTLARFVCRFDTTEAEADALAAALRRHVGTATAPRAAE